MSDDVIFILLIVGLLQLLIIYLFFRSLESIERNIKRTNHLLKLMYEKDGTRLTNEQLSMLNKIK
jgi:hypothetical protein